MRKKYFVVICNPDNFGQVVAHPLSMTGDDKDKLIAKAFAEKARIERNGNGPYSMFIGEITGQVIIKPDYEVVSL